MVIELRYNSRPLPATLVCQHRYELKAFVNNAQVVPKRWLVLCNNATLASGVSSPIVFTPVQALPHTITVTVPVEFGYQNAVFTVNAASTVGSTYVGVTWSKVSFDPGDPGEAAIVAASASGQAAGTFSWTLLLNNTQVQTGNGPGVSIQSMESGLYRLQGTATCSDGTVLAFDSAVTVSGAVTNRSAVPLPAPSTSLVYLGDVYSDEFNGGPGTATYFPYQLISHTQDTYLLPGTTHYAAAVVNLADGTIPPEVVLRTKAANWALLGFPAGLQGEDVGYDYGIGMPPVPAPADYRVQSTVDAWLPRATDAGSASWLAFNFRVRLSCYRQVANIYQYTRCPYSAYPGGSGLRARRLAALFTNADLQLDVNYGKNRLGTGDAIISYSTPLTTNIPLMTLDVAGSPNSTPYYTNTFFTDSNNYAIYEAYGQPNVYAKAVAGIEGIRPAYFSLLTYDGYPLICNRVKRLYGSLVVYLVDGALYAGSVVTVTVWKTGSSASATFSGTVPVTVYANTASTFAQALVIPVNLSDYQFDETGVVIDFAVSESGAVQTALPSPVPVPVTSATSLYSTAYHPTVAFDGACYSNPVPVPIFVDGQSGPVVVVTGCQDPACGPQGLYCYAPVYGAGAPVQLIQPLGFPAPYVSYGTQPYSCYRLSSFLSEYSGTGPALVAYPNSVPCGTPYLYTECPVVPVPNPSESGADLEYQPAPTQMLVIYPPSSSPHAAVEYNNRYYSYTGTLLPSSYELVVSAGSVTPSLNCYGAAYSGTTQGSTYLYRDAETGVPVSVSFPHLDVGLPVYGVAASALDEGLVGATAGSATAVFNGDETYLFTSTGTVTMAVNVGLPGVYKELVVDHNGTEISHNLGVSTVKVLPLFPSDTVSLVLSDQNGMTGQFRGMPVDVSWTPQITLPRLYASVIYRLPSASALKALGFCGYTEQASYAFYDSLPATEPVSGLLNPDGLVTVVSQGTEYLLVAMSGTGDFGLPMPPNVTAYAGQLLSGRVQFNFYTGRSATGAHGEMDAWFSYSGSVPATLYTQYHTLNSAGVAMQAAITDTTRNAYTVLSGGFGHSPSRYSSSAGQLISAENTSDSVVVNGTQYSYVAPDYGLAYNVVSASAVTAEAISPD